MPAFAISALLLMLPAFLPYSRQSTVEVDVNLINVFLTVHDSQGRYVSGLQRDDFRVFEDGQPRPIEVFETADGVRSSIGLLIDNSGSSADILGAIRTGVLDFANGLQTDDEIFVISFGTSDRVIHDFGDPLRDLNSTLGQLRSWGTSVFFDALYSGIRKLADGGNPRKALIVLTDGADNGSTTTYLDVVHAAERQLVTLYFIGMGPSVLVDTYTLRGLAAMTGGSVVLMGRDSSPREALDAIREDLSRQYYLGYYSAAGPGSHSVRVEVRGAGMTVRAREGFVVAPQDTPEG